MATEFQKKEDRRSWLEWPTSRICDLLRGLPTGWAQLADRLDETVRQLRVELAARQEADADLEVLRTSGA
jgi:hypothetical protein